MLYKLHILIDFPRIAHHSHTLLVTLGNELSGDCSHHIKLGGSCASLHPGESRQRSADITTPSSFQDVNPSSLIDLTVKLINVCFIYSELVGCQSLHSDVLYINIIN